MLVTVDRGETRVAMLEAAGEPAAPTKSSRSRKRPKKGAIPEGYRVAAHRSAVLGYEFAEKKIVYLSQTLKFTAPVYIGDTVTTTATITNIREDKNIVTMDTTCTKQDGEVVVKGESVVMVLP